MGDYCNQGKADYSDMIVHEAHVMSIINDEQTNRVCLSAHSYFCLNTAQYIHIVEYSECFITGVGEVSEDQWCLCAHGHLTEQSRRQTQIHGRAFHFFRGARMRSTSLQCIISLIMN